MRAVAILFCSLLLSGCALGPVAAPTPQRGLSLHGNLHGGQQPIAGSHVYLFAANTTGYGQPSVSALNASAPGVANDSVGAYVTTDSTGSFTITGDYTCTPGTQLYLYALGGNPGAGINSAVGLMAVLGECPASGSFLSSVPFILVNEVSTVAAAYSMAGFATDSTRVSSSGTPAAKIGLANAFAAASSLVNISTGVALTTTPNGNGAVDNTMVNTIANILAACINSTGASSTPCTTLFSNALSGGSTGSTPTDTATAAINIAHNPFSNTAALFALVPATVPFVPTYPSSVANFGVRIQYGAASNPFGLTIDDTGNVWITTRSNKVKISNSGAILAGASGYPDLPPGGVLFDQNGNALSADGDYLYQLSSSGSLTTYPMASGTCTGSAIDASGYIWCNAYDPNTSTNSLKKFSPSGTDLNFPNLSPVGNRGFAIDTRGNVWTGDGYHAYGTSMSTSQNVNIVDSFSAGSFAVDSAGSVWAAEPATFIIRFAYDAPTQSYITTRFTNQCIGYGPGFSPVVIDGSGSIWVASGTELCRLANDGSPMQSSFGYAVTRRYPASLAIDSSGNVWTGDFQENYVIKFIGAATPVVTPVSVALKNNKLGSRP
jgi:sugar lactone lactonase YvrE